LFTLPSKHTEGAEKNYIFFLLSSLESAYANFGHSSAITLGDIGDIKVKFVFGK